MYLLAFKLHSCQGDTEEALAVFGKLCTSPHVTGDEIQECFSVLVHKRMYEAAIHLGQHLLKACDRLVLDLNQ